MSKKLLLVFDDDSEVLNIPKYVIFNNDQDAQDTLIRLSDGWIKTVIIMSKTDNQSFHFEGKSWNGYGKAIWVESF